jgi:glycosyltransferase involved in cell wall biosynthesis
MKKTPVSVVVITRNEEENIGACLDSVKWADEVIVVDDNSTDRTREIASEYTDRIYERPMDNEGKHRNWAYSRARNDWVLSLDADERVTPELAVEISELLKGRPEFKAYTIPRRNHIGKYWLRWGGEYPAAQLRFFLRDEFRYEEAEVHPRAFLEGDCGHLEGDLIHYSHRDIADYVKSLNGHTTLEARKWFKSGKKMSFGHALWRSLDRCFYRRILRKKSLKDGVYGLTVAVFSGMYQLISWIKYRELKDPALNSGYTFSGVKADAEKISLEGRAKLSVVIITKNAGDKLRNCLESVRWVDEIVIVDGGSEDATLDIAGEYTDKIISSEFRGFDRERNKGADAATGDWILELDADEVVTEPFKQRLIGMLRGDDGGCVSFKFRRKNIFLGKPMMRGGWYHYSAHLFKKGHAYYEGDIHEKLIVDGKQGTMEEGVEHYPFLSVSEFITRQNRYTTLQAAEMYRNDPGIPEKEVLYNLRKKPVKLFRKMYLKKRGFIEGMLGTVFSALFAWVHYLKWAKYWELRQNGTSGAASAGKTTEGEI